MVLFFCKRVSEMLRCVAVQGFKAYELFKEVSEEQEGKKPQMQNKRENSKTAQHKAIK